MSDPDHQVRTASRSALARLPLEATVAASAGVTPTAREPRSSTTRFVAPSDRDVVLAAGVLAEYSTIPWAVLDTLPPGVGAAVVTLVLDSLLTEVTDQMDAADMGRTLADLAAAASRVELDLTGLLAVYRKVFLRSVAALREAAARSGAARSYEGAAALLVRRGVAWFVSRGGLVDLLTGLEQDLLDTDADRRLSAVFLIADVAAVMEIDEPTPAALTAPDDLLVEVVAGDDDVQFTVYRPKTVLRWRWHSLLVFVHRTTPFVDDDGTEIDPSEQVDRQARGVLGLAFADFGGVAAGSAAALPRGSELVIEPWIENSEVNPPRTVVRWEEAIHRLDFRVRVRDGVEGQRLQGRVRISLSVFLIGEVRFSVRVGTGHPARGEEEAEPVSGSVYRRIFASYSHQDDAIVERIADVVAVTGDRYLIDARVLRSGERWDDRLTELIAGADIFQLFWSHNSMRSDFVRREWEYALALQRDHFVRPVYWQTPLPAAPADDLPPPALRRLHFWRLAENVTALLEPPAPMLSWGPPSDHSPPDGGGDPWSYRRSPDGRRVQTSSWRRRAALVAFVLLLVLAYLVLRQR